MVSSEKLRDLGALVNKNKHSSSVALAMMFTYNQETKMLSTVKMGTLVSSPGFGFPLPKALCMAKFSLLLIRMKTTGHKYTQLVIFYSALKERHLRLVRRIAPATFNKGRQSHSWHWLTKKTREKPLTIRSELKRHQRHDTMGGQRRVLPAGG